MTQTDVQRLEKALADLQDEAVQRLSRWIRIDSTNGSEGKFQDTVADEYRKMGLEVDRFEIDLERLRKHPGFYESRGIREGQTYKGRPNVVATYRGAGAGKSLLFNGHSDTMFTGAPELWENSPTSGLITDGRVYGRGSSDMKCGTAAAACALEAVREAGLKPRGDVILTNVVDEEQSSNGSLACVERGYRADAGINLEGTENRICPSQSGGIVFRVRVVGGSGSVLREKETASIVDAAYTIYRSLREFAAKRPEGLSHHLIDPKTIGLYVAWFHAGTWNNILPTDAVLEGTFRYLPNEDQQEVKRKLADFVDSVADTDPFLKKHKPQVSFYQTWEASEIDRNHPLVTAMVDAQEKALGTPGVVGGREGGTDAWVFTRYGNTPMLSYGPGLNAMMHVANEYVFLKDYLESIRVLAYTICSWCGL